MTGEGIHCHWTDVWEGRITAIIRKPGDLPTLTDVTGRGCRGREPFGLLVPPFSKVKDDGVDDLMPVELLVCTTCRMGQPVEDGETCLGGQLFEALENGDLPDGVTLRGVECFSNCDHGCSITLRGGDARWSYVYGRLDPEKVAIVREGVARYRATSDGLVPWRERPEHFRKNCIARIPPLKSEEAAE